MGVPSPVDNEVLVKVTHAGINGGCETFRTRAEFAFSRNQQLENFPLGAEGCGVVCGVGARVKRLKPGDAVAFTAAGAFSEYVTAPALLCHAVPTASAEAVALILSGTTACCALEITGQVKASDTVLVTAAAGGTGHFAVQLAKLAGSHVIATCGGAVKADALRGLGVDRVIDYSVEDVDAVLAQEYPQGVAMVYEGVGGHLRQVALSHLAEGGTLLQVGYISEYPHARTAQQHQGMHGTGGLQGSSSSSSSSRNEETGAPGCTAASASSTVSEVPPAEELFWGNQDFAWGSRRIIGSIWPKDPKALARARRRVLQLHADGLLQAWVDASHGFQGLEDIPDAVEHMLRGQHIGKVVVPL